MSTTNFCTISSCNGFVGHNQKPEKLVSAFLSCPSSAYASPSFARGFNFAALKQIRFAGPCSVRISVVVKANASYASGASNEEVGSSTSEIGVNDLLIVGPGALGRIVAEKWREEYPTSQIYGQTISDKNHHYLKKMGIIPSLTPIKVKHKFPYVIFCAPQTGNPIYDFDVSEAVRNWNRKGSFLFTSKAFLYECYDGGDCDEDTPEVPRGTYRAADMLLKSEEIVLKAGGCVVRLAKLYKADKGVYRSWLDRGTVEITPDHITNLIHYEDAASLSFTILKKNLRGRIFLGCDNNPLSRQEMMDLANKSGKFAKKFKEFTGKFDSLGKKLNNSKTRAELGWEPKYHSFAQFLESL